MTEEPELSETKTPDFRAAVEPHKEERKKKQAEAIREAEIRLAAKRAKKEEGATIAMGTATLLTINGALSEAAEKVTREWKQLKTGLEDRPVEIPKVEALETLETSTEASALKRKREVEHAFLTELLSEPRETEKIRQWKKEARDTAIEIAMVAAVDPKSRDYLREAGNLEELTKESGETWFNNSLEVLAHGRYLVEDELRNCFVNGETGKPLSVEEIEETLQIYDTVVPLALAGRALERKFGYEEKKGLDQELSLLVTATAYLGEHTVGEEAKMGTVNHNELTAEVGDMINVIRRALYESARLDDDDRRAVMDGDRLALAKQTLRIAREVETVDILEIAPQVTSGPFISRETELPKLESILPAKSERNAVGVITSLSEKDLKRDVREQVGYQIWTGRREVAKQVNERTAREIGDRIESVFANPKERQKIALLMGPLMNELKDHWHELELLNEMPTVEDVGRLITGMMAEKIYNATFSHVPGSREALCNRKNLMDSEGRYNVLARKLNNYLDIFVLAQELGLKEEMDKAGLQATVTLGWALALQRQIDGEKVVAGPKHKSYKKPPPNARLLIEDEEMTDEHLATFIDIGMVRDAKEAEGEKYSLKAVATPLLWYVPAVGRDIAETIKYTRLPFISG